MYTQDFLWRERVPRLKFIEIFMTLKNITIRHGKLTWIFQRKKRHAEILKLKLLCKTVWRELVKQYVTLYFIRFSGDSVVSEKKHMTAINSKLGKIRQTFYALIDQNKSGHISASQKVCPNGNSITNYWQFCWQNFFTAT